MPRPSAPASRTGGGAPVAGLVARVARVARVALVALGAVAAGSLASCSDDDAGAPPTTSFGAGACTAADPPLAVDQIGAAVAAVERELGGAQRYFEINATPILVNLLVADPEAGTVTPYAFVGGELTAESPIEGASGNTFAASSIDIDPRSVVSCVAAQLPDSSLDLFFVEGGAEGAVRYAVLTSSAQGGQLVVEVSGTGLVLSVDPV